MALAHKIAAQANPGLVIFDCDGVLVDSEPISIDVLIETVAARGVTIARDAAYRDFLGRTLKAVSGALDADYGVVMDQVALDEMRGLLYARYREALEPMAGIFEALEAIDMPRCVASSSVYERIELSLKLTGLYEAFAPDIYSAAMVERGKPAPDLFLFAAQKMGVDPADCVVIEDSPAGIEAAQAAGMTVFAFTGGGHVDPAGLKQKIAALEPDLVFDDLRLLPDLLRSVSSKKRSR